ncbi:xyloglucan O-acetyltransferase 4-like [Humulus lupulus]|uniref:xyloglucan O-acetyltransferase 4-like n=1 Tax=Humulus lupulus TaxID=3486 RepID=UPI002B412548|nr:xyloglucan O-acetyltransferase 4-like [Humulus lupulus]
MGKIMVPFLFTSLAIVTVFSFFPIRPNPFKVIPKQGLISSVQNLHAAQDNLSKTYFGKKEVEKCDLFTGHWVPELRGSLYTNLSCKTIPESRNCFKNGRQDVGFLNWRWKPEKCELPRFDAKAFLEMVRGKKMAFVGDSLARNHVESLLCFLSQEEIPMEIYKDSEDRFQKWYFTSHDFTLMIMWTKFFVAADEIMVNGTSSGTYDLQLDKVENTWADFLPELDYAIISSGHWFFRVMYLHQANNLIGCVYCNKPNMTQHKSSFAIRMAFRTAFDYINSCKNCTGLVTLTRTYSPSHFENGFWNTGGNCNRTSPLSEGEIDLGGFEWEIRKFQMEEIERAREIGEKQGKKFGVVDVTRAMLMRADGHPGSHWDNKWIKGCNDCTHWCMPGPVDHWNDFLMAALRKESGDLVL